MASYGMTKQYLTKNGAPWFPVMGEIHYSRLPENTWEEALYKMKAGGIQVASTYVIWIHHEEEEGKADFSGNRNVRKFVQLADKCGLQVSLRIGPWCHGEVRNGGFPDWLLHKAEREGFRLRTDDAGYLAEVEKFYRRIYAETQGLFCAADGGTEPVIAIQLENEYGHCGGLHGGAGETHMRTLRRLAEQAGFTAPFFTATGWGGAVTGGMLPVMGGYCEAPWDPRLTEIEPSGNYLFTHERNDHAIGSDFGTGSGLTFNPEDFPYLTAELGGGIQITRHRRPVAYAEDTGAMSLAKLGSGVNLLGYYMYHGGTNPEGRLSTMQETRETGSPNDLPELSYDFRAPLREYGQVSPAFRELKLLTLFLRDFGSGLCTLPAVIPESNPKKPEDTTSLRHAFRCKDGRGYVFLSAFQRRRKLSAHENIRLTVPESGEALPPLDVEPGDYYFFPFHMQLENPADTGGYTALDFADASPLCVIRAEGGKLPVTVFYAGQNRTAEGCTFRFAGAPQAFLLVLTRREARNAWPVQAADGGRLLLTEAAVTETHSRGVYRMLTRVPPDAPQIPQEFSAWPPLHSVPQGFAAGKRILPVSAGGAPAPEGRLYVPVRKPRPESSAACGESGNPPSVSFRFLEGEPPEPRRDHSGGAYSSGSPLVCGILLRNLPALVTDTEPSPLLPGESRLHDIFLHIGYEGESARLYCGGVLVADNLYPGKLRDEDGRTPGYSNPDWEISLRCVLARAGEKAKAQMAAQDGITLKLEVFPLDADAPVFLEERPVFPGGKTARVSGMTLEGELETALDLRG